MRTVSLSHMVRTQLALAVLSVIAASATAQTVSTGDAKVAPDESGPRDLGITLQAGASHMFDSELDSTPSRDLSITRYELGALYRKPTAGGFLRGTLTYEYSEYDFSGIANDLDVDRIALDLFYTRPVRDEWGFFLMGGTHWTAEHDASLGEGFTATIAGGPSYAFSDDFELFAGLGYSTRLEDSNAFFPAIGINWHITDKLFLRTANGAFLTYDWHGDESLLLDVSAEYQSRDIRVESTPATGDTAFEDTAWILNLGATQTFENGWHVRPGVVVLLHRQLETRSARLGVADVDQDPGIGLNLQAGYTF